MRLYPHPQNILGKRNHYITKITDPSSHWRNETNAFDASLTSFADNQPKPKIPNYVQFSGQTINLGAREKAKDLIMTGFNFYLSEYLNANYPPW
ncbi:MAG: hypothetical protein A3D24_03425 [Candidatus Blackburnbacteria bacterium RIFCSPHIGHO2_02_FULL_39_13]|uniref:Uncharacterized protein n=1 Tax=Candidatus Blackburnbacteria bacterium RIFCSPLOWO2_01_FULL_40_20 TaxID=1797519 RepID=A0A1G1VEC1_9BACT|nr:MAG: hypothetical protein A3D24_03425 [Candidatus Blackburnbacteria bacterium RIFCSPHIGHO2_02_FULL_39_13]OGY13774.1 MAG: hypothetical protein A3A77_02750 [Candidatus Blackburnbacteria bacterium RIFCSPLOWO2_01_FULL_40_20]OGY15183.1 MAG: hypothetical protein A3I52_00725 [Candidatus Blackburnbacteria bacterium RIFCSPLOWO2_02_FULL_40_10]